MMLTLYDFNSLDEKGKGEAVFLNATYIDDRAEEGLRIQLYRLLDFYVEVYYDPQKNAIIHYRSFNRLGQLAPYV